MVAGDPRFREDFEQWQKKGVKANDASTGYGVKVYETGERELEGLTVGWPPKGPVQVRVEMEPDLRGIDSVGVGMEIGKGKVKYVGEFMIGTDGKIEISNGAELFGVVEGSGFSEIDLPTIGQNVEKSVEVRRIDNPDRPRWSPASYSPDWLERIKQIFSNTE